MVNSNGDYVREYMLWLGRKSGLIRDDDPLGDQYFNLVIELFKHPYVPMIKNDENRYKDALALRYEFRVERNYGYLKRLNDYPCSFLELLVSVGQRMDYGLTDGTESCISTWIFLMLDNIGLSRYTDDYFENEDEAYQSRMEILSILLRFDNRDFEYDGTGGLFPLKHPHQDQRETELWFQMNSYMIENYDELMRKKPAKNM